MKAKSTLSHERTHWSIPHSTCRICAAFEVCRAAACSEDEGPQQVGYVVPARHIIVRAQDPYDAVPFICSGWAATVVALSGGRRQIISLLLPGDIFSITLLFDSQPRYRIEAVTEVYYRTFNRAELRALLCAQPDLAERFSKTWVDEKTRTDELVVDLGRRTAEERIARMIFNLIDRLAKRGMVRDNSVEIDFPLRQHHIADLTGLTPVHVSKVLTEFRRSGLVKISKRLITLLDSAGLMRLAQMP